MTMSGSLGRQVRREAQATAVDARRARHPRMMDVADNEASKHNDLRTREERKKYEKKNWQKELSRFGLFVLIPAGFADA